MYVEARPRYTDRERGMCDREDCALNIRAESNLINCCHIQITDTPPLVVIIIDPSVTLKKKKLLYTVTELTTTTEKKYIYIYIHYS